MVHLIYYIIIIIIILHERAESKKPAQRRVRSQVPSPRMWFCLDTRALKNYLHSHSTLLYTSLITIKLEAGHPFLSTLCFLLNYDRWRASHDFSVVLIHLYYLHVQHRTHTLFFLNSFFFYIYISCYFNIDILINILNQINALK